MKKTNNLKVSSQFCFCPYAFSLDLYSGCPHSCVYCFAQSQYYTNVALGKQVFGTVYGGLDLRVLEKYLKLEYKDSKCAQTLMLQDLIRIRQPLHVGGMFDPFPRGAEPVHQIGKKFLELMNKYDYPAIISTKNPPTEYKELFKAGKYILQVSIVTIDNETSKKFELGAPTPTERLKAIKELKGSVKKIVVRWQPFIPKLFEKPNSIENYLDKIQEVGADAVTVEFIKLGKFIAPSVKNQFEVLGKAIGCNLLSELKKNKAVYKQDLEYPFLLKKKILEKIKIQAHKRGLEFYSAENDCRALGDDFACCGVNSKKDKEFESKMGCFNQALFIAREKGEVSFSDLKFGKYANLKGILHMWNTQNRKLAIERKNYTLLDFVKRAWNTPTQMNPAIFFKGLKPVKEGRKIKYLWVGLDEKSRN